MKRIAAALPVARTLAAAAPRLQGHSPLLHLLFSFGILGVFLVSIIDSSFIPLPIPGITDIMLIVMAAQHQGWFLLVLILAATIGSAIGGYLSHQAGQRGGMAFIEKRISPRAYKPICDWMESHAILSIALPAILPPPMPLSPFVLAAGALHMSRRKFMTTFTISRGLRHALAAWLGLHYGRHILNIWNSFSAHYATPILIALWAIIILSAGLALRKLYKTSRAIATHPASLTTEN